jgi:hypothetical protein|tara:strand:+ start:1774 stop:1947 length:174 start_codon:yes stop_codon:yes gene_type:complete
LAIFNHQQTQTIRLVVEKRIANGIQCGAANILDDVRAQSNERYEVRSEDRLGFDIPH